MTTRTADAMKQHVLSTYAMTLDQARKLVDGVPCERCAEEPFEGAKHPAWVLTHLCLGSGMMIGYFESPDNPQPGLGGVPADWAPIAMPGSDVAYDRATYPKKDNLLTELARAHTELVKRFEAASPELLAAEFPHPEYRAFFPTIGAAAFYLMAYHEGYHLGQLSGWRRAAGFPPLTD
ncbi:MAG: DinB family protein [Phycisphaerales bacterium JB040]